MIDDPAICAAGMVAAAVNRLTEAVCAFHQAWAVAHQKTADMLQKRDAEAERRDREFRESGERLDELMRIARVKALALPDRLGFPDDDIH